MKYHDTPVAEFHRAFGHPVEYTPRVPNRAQILLRVKLLAEELCELAVAAGVRLDLRSHDYPNPSGGTMADAFVSVADADPRPMVDLKECADALGDLRYLVDGGNLIFGFPGEAVLLEIHRSNMSKLGADGKPVTREDGKTLRGPNYFKPDILGAINNAIDTHKAETEAYANPPAGIGCRACYDLGHVGGCLSCGAKSTP